MHSTDRQKIRQLFDDYLRMYATRDDRLTSYFSEDFSGFTGGGDFLVKDKAEWVAITRQDFAQVKASIRIELKDLAIQYLADTVAVATGFFTIHLPIKDHILSRETARLVLIFREEAAGWKITHSSISIPYHLVREGEVYPLKELAERNDSLEKVIAERTLELSAANDRLRRVNEELAREIAGHKQAVDALQRSEGRYRSILNASPDDITITDRDGRIVMVSPMAFKIFGYRGNEEFLGLSVIDFIVPEDRNRALAQIALKRQGVVTGATEYRGLRADGSTFDIEVNSEFIRDAEGSPAGMVVIVRDISERKEVEAEREKLIAQNRQLQKAESLGRMAGAIAHTFNNQLGAVMANLELALTGLPEDTEPARRLTAAMEAAAKAASVSGQMLTYLGQSFGKRVSFDLSATCLGSLPILRAAMPAKVVLETHLPVPGPVVIANVEQILQVLTNLLTNAWEALGGGSGSICLGVKTVSRAEIPATHRYPALWQPQNEAYACLELTDDGCGIVGKDIDNLFDPFFSSKFTGRGLGLATVLGIAKAHQGAVTFETEPGRGSTFRVFLPMSAEEVPQPPVKASPPLTLVRGATVLLVEDEASVRETTAVLLARLGLTVLEASDGIEGMAVFRLHQAEIRCVLCDLTMPRMDGWETLTALRQLAPELPVILASGYDRAQVMSGKHPEWPQAFLAKPYTGKQLGEAISQALIKAGSS